MAEKTTIHYFSSTHWDREWYRSFQDFRMRLVDTMDQVLDTLESDPDFVCFHLDGQTIPLDDYLEIRPENADRVRQLVSAGRLLLGPWYVQPDLMLVGGESLVRNLMLGDRESRKWGGEPLKFGYMCDMFGHPAMMPQILAGFDIPVALLGRGTNEHSHPAHFRWRSPDGSEVMVFKEQDVGGYGSWWLEVRTPAGESELDVEKLVAEAKKFVARERARDPNVPHVLAMDGQDHQPIWRLAPEAMKILRERLSQYEWVQDSLDDYAAAMTKHADAMPVFEGELRDTAKQADGYLWLIPHTLSSRLPLKQANDSIQNLLCHWAEPLVLWANLGGADIPDMYLPLAWRYLLKNNPHDSICGCSIDQVHRDMVYRYDQARMIADGVTERAMRRLAGTPEPTRSDAAPAGLTVRIFNPLPHAERRTIELDLDLGDRWPTRLVEAFGYEQKAAFKVTDTTGQDVPYQLLHIDKSGLGPIKAISLPEQLGVHRVALMVNLPAMGFTTLNVVPHKSFTRVMGSLRTGPASAVNEHVGLGISADGLVKISNFATGQSFSGLLAIEDTGDLGDGWFHQQPVGNRTVVAGGSATVSCLHDGPMQTSFRIDRVVQVPAGMEWKTLTRLEQTVELRLSHTLTLRAGQPYVEVTTRIANNALDHRLRLLLPTRMRTGEFHADEPFGMVCRKVGVDNATAEWKEPDVPERSMWSIATVGESVGGLAFISGGGLKEVAVMDDAARTMAVTLFRSYRRTVNTGGEPGGQLQGPLEARFALAPFAGEVNAAALMGIRDALQVGLRTICGAAVEPKAVAGTNVASFCELDNPSVRFSALKAAEDGDGAILRVFNPTGDRQEATAKFDRQIASAQMTDLNERPAGPNVGKGNAVKFVLAPYKIATVRIGWR